MWRTLCAGWLLLAGAAIPAAELRVSGILGQSQPAEALPLPSLACAGVAVDGKGGLWMSAGTALHRCVQDAAGSWTVAASIALPTGLAASAALWYRDGRLLAVLGDQRICVVDPTSGRIERIFALPAGTTRCCSPGQPGPGAARFPLVVLAGRQVLGLGLQDQAPVPLLTIGETKAGVEAIGVLGDGDVVVGTGYPDMHQYRYAATGQQVSDRGWPRRGWPRHYLTVGGSTWVLTHDGAISLLDKGRDQDALTLPSVAPIAANVPCAGMAATAQGWWMATARGLVQVDSRGQALRRLGGLPNPTGVALAADGTVLVLAESRRVVRWYIDDGPATAPDSSGNEPWLVQANWTSAATAIASDGTAALLTESATGRLWRFDPAFTVWGAKPWVPCSPDHAWAAGGTVTVGDCLVRVASGGRVYEADRRTQPMAFKAVDLPVRFPPAWIAADGDDRILCASATAVAACVRTANGWKQTWQVAGASITALAALPDRVVVAETNRIRLLHGQDGRTLATLETHGIPGRRLDAVALAARHPWVLVADRAGARLLRLRVVP